jgi:protocatechuate 3,4-dioxygenase beta subunit
MDPHDEEVATMSEDCRLTRRLLLTGSLAAGSVGLVIPADAAFAQGTLTPTPACDERGAVTVRQTEGPFFKPRSPERSDLVEPSAKGRIVELAGVVLTRSCKPVARALVDLWHADDTGEYDNRGNRYRGHVFTDANGRYRFRTILPAEYPGRTRHYHVKVQGAGRPVLTTQLYFPNDPANRRDGFFRKELLMRVATSGDALSGRFDFVLDIR